MFFGRRQRSGTIYPTIGKRPARAVGTPWPGAVLQEACMCLEEVMTSAAAWLQSASWSVGQPYGGGL